MLDSRENSSDCFSRHIYDGSHELIEENEMDYWINEITNYLI